VKVRCVNSSGQGLDLDDYSHVLRNGKIYEAREAGGNLDYLISDSGKEVSYDRRRFEVVVEPPTQDLKKDAGKPLFALIDPFFLLGVAKVLTFGAVKYAEEKWREGIKYKRVLHAIHRHLNAIERGEDVDPETGELHTSHLACEVMFLDSYIRNKRTDLDDRIKL